MSSSPTMGVETTKKRKKKQHFKKIVFPYTSKEMDIKIPFTTASKGENI